jgi:hypothetical protein
MHDGGKIIVGLIIFIVLISFPIWYNVAGGKAGYVPDLEKAKGENCVEDTEWMRNSHMDLLDDWRDRVVRDGERMYKGVDGKMYEMSMTHTCLDCHENKDRFCDRCHDYLSVSPYCWECHVDPKEVSYGN